jgi:hypothetical protein
VCPEDKYSDTLYVCDLLSQTERRHGSTRVMPRPAIHDLVSFKLLAAEQPLPGQAVQITQILLRST